MIRDWTQFFTATRSSHVDRINLQANLLEKRLRKLEKTYEREMSMEAATVWKSNKSEVNNQRQIQSKR